MNQLCSYIEPYSWYLDKYLYILYILLDRKYTSGLKKYSTLREELLLNTDQHLADIHDIKNVYI